MCLLDENGLHKAPLKHDYPSLEEMMNLLRLEKVNVIFLVNDATKFNYYKKLQKQVFKDSAFVGKLTNTSDNILELISSGN